MTGESEARVEWQRRKREEHLRQHNLFRQRFMNAGENGGPSQGILAKLVETSEVGSLLESGSEGHSKLESYNTSDASSLKHDESFKTMSESENTSESENENQVHSDFENFEELD